MTQTCKPEIATSLIEAPRNDAVVEKTAKALSTPLLFKYYTGFSLRLNACG